MATNRKRQRSATPPRHPSTSTDAPPKHRADDEWEKLENGSVLLLPPTASIVHGALHTTVGESGGLVVKVAAFDMDDTLIKPPSGAVFARDDPSDWQWVHPHVPEHLQYLHQHGFLVAVFSNQMGIGKGSGWNAAKAEAVQKKVVQLSRAANVPLCACVATREDAWRKPSVRLWKLLEERVVQCVGASLCAAASAEAAAASNPVVDCEAYSFYVGDAAGRSITTLAGRKKDFSCSDRSFAYNLQLPFFTPEQLFLGAPDTTLQEDALTKRCATSSNDEASKGHTHDEPLLSQPSSSSASYRLHDNLLRLLQPAPDGAAAVPFSWGDVSPEELRRLPRTYAQLSLSVITARAVQPTTLPTSQPFFARPGQQEMIIFVGFPGCGKSSFYQQHLRPYGYLQVNRDTLQTRAKCLRAAEEYWSGGRSVVVDNTNPTSEDRQAYINVVKKHMKVQAGSAPPHTLPVRFFVFTHTRGLASHMNQVRAQAQGVPRVPTIAYNVFQSRQQRPTTPAEVAALAIDSVWEIPPIASFDGAPPGTEKAFFLLT